MIGFVDDLKYFISISLFKIVDWLAWGASLTIYGIPFPK